MGVSGINSGVGSLRSSLLLGACWVAIACGTDLEDPVAADSTADEAGDGSGGANGGPGGEVGGSPDGGPDNGGPGGEVDDDGPADEGEDGPSEDSGMPDEEPEVLRFVLLGDGGEGNDAQFAVAAAVEQVCADRGCDFALYLGDNFYDVGVESPMDEQFVDKFEMPYMDLDLRFYIALGNHDYGALGNEWGKSQHQVMYSQFSDKWFLPSEYYTFDLGPATFVALDTSRLFWDQDTAAQEQFIQQAWATSTRPWKIVFGHHPYISNGEHGNAGNYEGLPVPIVGGETVKEFFEANVCDKASVYFCGHDHNRQWHQPTCGTEFVVSGAAAKITPFANRDGNPNPRYQDDQEPGFGWVELTDQQMTVAFYDQEGQKDYEQTIDRP